MHHNWTHIHSSPALLPRSTQPRHSNVSGTLDVPLHLGHHQTPALPAHPRLRLRLGDPPVDSSGGLSWTATGSRSSPIESSQSRSLPHRPPLPPPEPSETPLQTPLTPPRTAKCQAASSDLGPARRGRTQSRCGKRGPGELKRAPGRHAVTDLPTQEV